MNGELHPQKLTRSRFRRLRSSCCHRRGRAGCRGGASGGGRESLRTHAWRSVRQLPRNLAAVFRLAHFRAPQRGVHRLPWRRVHAERGIPHQQYAPRVHAPARRGSREAATAEQGCVRDGAALPEMPRRGICGVASQRAQRQLLHDFSERRAQSQAAADGRLPALPRHAFRGRHPRPGDSDEHERSVAIEARRTCRPNR